MRAAEQGDPMAQYMVGRAYKIGSGVDADEAEAFRWYLRAADQEHILAQLMVANHYEGNVGPVPRNLDKAIHYYERAARQGAAAASFRLYQIYRGSEGVPVDRALAYMWIIIAFQQGHGVAEENLPAVEASLSEAEYEKGRQMAEAWFAEFQ